MLGKNTTECHQWTCVEMYLTQKNAVIIFSFFKKKKESLSNHNLHGRESEWRRCGAVRLTKLEGHNYKINIKVNTFFNKGWWGNSRKAGLDQIVSKEQS